MEYHLTRTRKPGCSLACITMLAILGALASCNKHTPEAPARQQRVVRADTVVIVAYNVENLFDLTADGSEYDEFVPGSSGWTESMFRIKLGNAASVIAAAAADIALLCEVENARALQVLREELRRKGRRYDYAAIDTVTPGASVRPSILSRFPLDSVRVLSTPSTGQREMRGMLEADVRIGDATLKVFVLHWPSKSHPESERIACARVLMQRIRELPPSTDYVIGGDLNAGYDECETFRASKLDDTHGETSTNHVLGTVSSLPRSAVQYVDEKALMASDAGLHYDLWLELAEAARCSYVFRGVCGTPDHLILPPAMLDSSGLSYVDNSFDAFTWEGRLLNDGEPFRWQMQYRGKKKVHLGKGYSDHLPLRMRVRVGPFVAMATPVPTKGASRPAAHAPIAKKSTFMGWQPISKKVRITEEDVDGACVKVTGFSDKETLPALRRVVTVPAGITAIVFRIRGSGKPGFRLRTGDGRWWYFSAPDFQPKRSGRYLSWRSEQWTDVRLPLAPLGPCAEAEVEVRIGKGEACELWIGNFELK